MPGPRRPSRRPTASAARPSSGSASSTAWATSNWLPPQQLALRTAIAAVEPGWLARSRRADRYRQPARAPGRAGPACPSASPGAPGTAGQHAGGDLRRRPTGRAVGRVAHPGRCGAHRRPAGSGPPRAASLAEPAGDQGGDGVQRLARRPARCAVTSTVSPPRNASATTRSTARGRPPRRRAARPHLRRARSSGPDQLGSRPRMQAQWVDQLHRAVAATAPSGVVLRPRLGRVGGSAGAPARASGGRGDHRVQVAAALRRRPRRPPRPRPAARRRSGPACQLRVRRTRGPSRRSAGHCRGRRAGPPRRPVGLQRSPR